MARIKIVGRDWVNVSQAIADKVSSWKSNESYQPNKVVDLGYLGNVELGQIKQVVPDDPGALKESDENQMRSEQRKNEMDEYDMQVAVYRLQPAAEKARRIATTWALLLWTIRGNWTKEKPRLPEELVEKIVKKLTPYFEEHPAEWTCGREQYEKLIQYGTPPPRSAVKGVVTIGQGIAGK